MPPNSETPTRRFRPLPFTDMQWTGTNHTEIADKFGTDWEESLVGHPLLVGNWLYRLEGGPEVYVMTSRVRDAFTEELGRG